MASILPTCPRCGSHNVTMTHFDHHTKVRTYQCNACYKRFTQQFESAVYTAPMGEPADNGKPVLCNEQTERHSCEFVEDFYAVDEQDEDEQWRDWLIDLGNMYYGGMG